MGRDQQTMGPPASEPEQRDYAITITAPDGTTASAGIVRSHHALDAAREAAEARGLGAVVGESAVSGAWAASTASGHVVRAEAVFGQARALPRRTRPPCPPCDADDERAATQRRIADAIRSQGGHDGDAIAAITALCHDGSSPFACAVLYIAASNDTIADALAQVRQAIVLARK